MSSYNKNEQELKDSITDLAMQFADVSKTLTGPNLPTFEQIDTDRSGGISPAEFQKFVENQHKTDRNRQIGALAGKLFDLVFLALLVLNYLAN